MGRKKHTRYTHYCKYCDKEFLAKISDERMYCSRSCQSKAIKKIDSRFVSQCVICKKEFRHYGERILCSRECTSKYMSNNRVGENNPYYKHRKNKFKCRNCNKQFCYNRAGMHVDQVRKFCSSSCFSSFYRGKGKDGGELKYNNPYPKEFKSARKQTKSRDNFSCVLCGVGNKIHVHHIDYDKQNNDLSNLVALCMRCHMMTNFNRSFWENTLTAIMSGSKIVKKGWGLEVHLTNNSKYCLKYLVFFAGKRFSVHSHFEKKELWYCMMGKLKCTLRKEKDGDEECIIFDKGDKVEVDQGTIHQLYAIKNSIIVEVSTTDFPEDSYRLEKGD